MALSEWIPLVILFMAGGLTPGPAVLLIIAASLRYGFSMALVAALGICMANLIWLTLAATGAGLILQQFPMVFMAVKVIGVVFVSWIAWQIATQPVDTEFEESISEVFGKNAKARPRFGRIAALFFRGIGLQLANPNALVYFGALLPAFFVKDEPIMSQVLTMAVTVTATELIGLTVYAGAARMMSSAFSDPKFARIFYVSASILMVASVIWAAFK